MGLGCKPYGKLQSIFRKLDNKLEKAAMEKLKKSNNTPKEKSKE